MSLTFTSVDGAVWPLDGTTGVTALEGGEGFFEIPVELGLEDLVAFDGASLYRSRFAPRRLVLPLLLSDSTEILSVWRRLSSALLARPISPLPGVGSRGGTLTYDGPGGQRTLENVVFESADRSMTGYDLQASRDDKMVVSLLALDPWWYGPIESTTMNLAAGTPIDAAIPIDDPNTPMDGGDSTQVTVAGDELSFPTFVIDGPFTTLTLDGPTTGETITLAGALADGDQIVVDASPLNRGPRLNGDPVSWQLLTPTSRLFLLPRPVAVVSMNATGTGANSRVELRWRNRYMTP